MRDLLLLAFIVALAPVAAALPYVGVLLWSWLSFMNPHREVYGAASTLPLNLVIAALTLGGWMLSKDRRPILRNPTVILLILFLLWTCLTTVTALDQPTALPLWERNLKSFVLVFAVIGLMHSKTRIQALVWTIALSLGYFAVKGAAGTLIHGGQYRISGPPDTMISDNNSLGLAFVMLIPLLNYLRISSRVRIVATVAMLVMGAAFIAVVGTYSRGDLFGLIVVGAALAARSRQRIFILVAAAAFIFALPFIVPQKWYERMSTIKEYSQDSSFDERAQAWEVSFNIARARPLTGGGFSAVQVRRVWENYVDPREPKNPHAAHSIYFQVLGDHGFVGLFLYLLILVVSFINLNTAIRIAKSRDDLKWAAELGRMIQVTFVGFLAAGALLSMAYYDVFLVLIGVSANLAALMRQAEIDARERAEIRLPQVREAPAT